MSRAVRGRWAGRAALAAMAVLLGACAIPEDANPREIVGEDRRALNANPNTPGGVGSGSARIYLVAPGGPLQGLLRAVPREVGGNATELVEALLGGPNVAEQRLQLTSAIPAGTRLVGASISGSVLTIDLHGPLDELSADAQVEAIGQIVLTLSEIPGIQSVKITLDGADVEWPNGFGELQHAPLTRYDFPGRAENSQPEFPATPSPTVTGATTTTTTTTTTTSTTSTTSTTTVPAALAGPPAEGWLGQPKNTSATS